MLIDFSDIEEKPLEHFKGGEGTFFARMFTDPKVKIMRGRLEHGASIGLHTHEGNSEIVFILEGKGKMLCDGRYEELSAGSCTYCPEGHDHSLINDSKGDLIFYGSGRGINHVAMYIGDGKVVHASTERTGIKTSPWNYRTPVKIVNVLG